MKISIVLLLVGLLLGAGYPMYTTLFSGEEVAELPFISRDTSNISLGGFSLSNSKDAGSVSEQSMDLSLDMNPIRLNASANYSFNGRTTSSNLKSNFEVSFFHQGELLWTEPFSFSENPSSDDTNGVRNVNSSQTLKVTELEKGGVYTFKLRPKDPQELNVSSLNISVRRNVSIAEPKIYITGGVLFLVGLIGAFMVSRKAKAKKTKTKR